MSKQNIMAALAVSDIAAGSAWYTKLLARGPTERPYLVYEWEFPGGWWLPVFEKPQRAGMETVTIVEDDLETRIASLQTAHVRIDRESEFETTAIAVVEDGDGDRITLPCPGGRTSWSPTVHPANPGERSLPTR